MERFGSDVSHKIAMSASSAPRVAFVHRMLEHAISARFLRRHTFAHELFAKHEQQRPLGGGFVEWTTDGQLLYSYRVPRCVCIGHGGTMPLGAVVALVDEVTTWASLCVDRHHRPGVSISLEAELSQQQRPPVEGDQLIFAARVEKLGRTLGFQSCEIHDAATGRRVARGYHTKMLDMGRAWSLMLGPLFPLTERLVTTFSAASRPAPAIDPHDATALERLLAPTSTQVDGSTCVSGFSCVPQMLQETNIMFGGAQAMVHEVAARAAAETALQRSEPAASIAPVHCSSMLVRYLAGAGLGDQLEAHATASMIYRGEGVAATSRLVRAGVERSSAEMQFVRSD